ncbi:MAG: hypothetical protein FWF86_09265 [Clostridia bacterium]|nr:hypothetical protein [Clostridia bacterium]
MTIEPIKSFDTIAQRILYGLNFMYSEFVLVASEAVSEQAQRKLHGLMTRMIDKLYENPALLNLTDHKDEAYQAWEINNMKPELDKVYQSIFKALYEFYKFLYISALHGEISGHHLSIGCAALKEHKAGYKPQYNTLLKEIGIEVTKDKTDVFITADNELLQSLKLLAENTPVNVNPCTSYALINFACCSFAGDYSFPFAGDFNFLLARVDHVAGLNSLLFEIQNRCLENGYEKIMYCSFGASGFDFSIRFQNKVGGFLIGYNPRKYQPFYFGTINGIGEKAMLEDFDNLDEDLQAHFINICRTCSGCLGCTKGGKNKIFATNVTYEGKEYNLCPSFPCHSWDTIDRGLMDVLFKYHAAQEKYGVNWKKK